MSLSDWSVPATKWLYVADGAGDQTVDQDPAHALGHTKDGLRPSQRTGAITTIFLPSDRSGSDHSSGAAFLTITARAIRKR